MTFSQGGKQKSEMNEEEEMEVGGNRGEVEEVMKHENKDVWNAL